MTESPTLPEVASKKEILEHYEAEGKLPRPFAPFMTDNEKLAPPSPTEEKKANRSSVASWISIPRNSFLSAAPPNRASVASFASSTASGGTSSGATKDKRLIRQTFNPVLPDELVVSIGERFAGKSFVAVVRNKIQN